MREYYNKLRAVFLFSLALISVTIFWGGIYYLSSLIAMLIAAGVFSVVLSPAVDFLTNFKFKGKKIINRTVAASLTLVASVLLVLGVFVMIIPSLSEEIVRISNMDMHDIADKISDYYDSAENNWLHLSPEIQNDAEEFFKNTIINLFQNQKITKVFGSAATGVGNLIFYATTILFIMFFLLNDPNIIPNSLTKLVKKGNEEEFHSILLDSNKIITNYCVGLLQRTVVLIIITIIPLYFIGVKHVLVIGIITAVLNIIPYLGPLIGNVIALLLVAISHFELGLEAEMFSKLWQTFVALMAVQILDNFVLQPIIFSNSVKAHPLEIFIVTIAAGIIGGMGGLQGSIVGMIIAVPFYSIMRVIFSSFMKFIRGTQSQIAD